MYVQTGRIGLPRASIGKNQEKVEARYGMERAASAHFDAPILFLGQRKPLGTFVQNGGGAGNTFRPAGNISCPAARPPSAGRRAGRPAGRPGSQENTFVRRGDRFHKMKIRIPAFQKLKSGFPSWPGSQLASRPARRPAGRPADGPAGRPGGRPGGRPAAAALRPAAVSGPASRPVNPLHSYRRRRALGVGEARARACVCAPAPRRRQPGRRRVPKTT